MKKVVFLLLVVFTAVIFYGCDVGTTPESTKDLKSGADMLGEVVEAERQAVGDSTVEIVSPKVEVVRSVSGDTLLVADFNSGSKPSNIGSDFGAWDKDPADFSQTCTDAFDSVVKSGDTGFSMKLTYDVDSPNPAYNGFWLKLNDIDASNFRNLTFAVRGDEDAGYTTVFKVELKKTNGEVGKFYVSSIESTWKEISIPLNQFSGINDVSGLGELVIVFEDAMTTNKEGIIYLDDIRFTQ